MGNGLNLKYAAIVIHVLPMFYIYMLVLLHPLVSSVPVYTYIVYTVF